MQAESEIPHAGASYVVRGVHLSHASTSASTGPSMTRGPVESNRAVR